MFRKQEDASSPKASGETHSSNYPDPAIPQSLADPVTKEASGEYKAK
jgi:hypothetical protein